MTLSEATIPMKRAAALADVSYKTIQRWIADGRLAAKRKGGRIYTSQKALELACPDLGPSIQNISRNEARRIMREAMR